MTWEPPASALARPAKSLRAGRLRCTCGQCHHADTHRLLVRGSYKPVVQQC